MIHDKHLQALQILSVVPEGVCRVVGERLTLEQRRKLTALIVFAKMQLSSTLIGLLSMRSFYEPHPSSSTLYYGRTGRSCSVR